MFLKGRFFFYGGMFFIDLVSVSAFGFDFVSSHQAGPHDVLSTIMITDNCYSSWSVGESMARISSLLHSSSLLLVTLAFRSKGKDCHLFVLARYYQGGMPLSTHCKCHQQAWSTQQWPFKRRRPLSAQKSHEECGLKQDTVHHSTTRVNAAGKLFAMASSWWGAGLRLPTGPAA